MPSRGDVLVVLSSKPLWALPQSTVGNDGGDHFGVLVWILELSLATKGRSWDVLLADLLHTGKKWTWWSHLLGQLGRCLSYVMSKVAPLRAACDSPSTGSPPRRLGLAYTSWNPEWDVYIWKLFPWIKVFWLNSSRWSFAEAGVMLMCKPQGSLGL